MIEITKNGNVSVILFTDSDYYLFNSGQILAPLGSLTMVLDKSDMVTFRKAANNDLLFSAKLGKVKINGTTLTKQNAQSLFDAAMGGSGGGSGIRFEEVQQLPATGENGVIYLVPNGDDTFTEWVWLEDEERFEKLGYDVDLSSYYTKTQVDGLITPISTNLASLQEEVDDLETDLDSNYYTETEVDNLLGDYYTKDEIDDGNLTISAALNELHDEKQDKLTFDSTPTAGSSNPVTSNGIVTYLLNNYYNNQWVDMHLLELQQAMNAAIEGIEENYQTLLTFDTAPTQGSENPVTSGGIYTALQNVQPDLSNYYDKDDIDEGNRVVSTALNRLDSGKADKTQVYDKAEVDALIQSIYDRISELPQYSYIVELVNVGTPTETIRLSEDGSHSGTLTANTTYRIDVSRYLSSGQYVADPLNCGDFEIDLTDYQDNEVAVTNCRFTTNGTAAENDYTLEITVGSKTLHFPNIMGTV